MRNPRLTEKNYRRQSRNRPGGETAKESGSGRSHKRSPAGGRCAGVCISEAENPTRGPRAFERSEKVWGGFVGWAVLKGAAPARSAGFGIASPLVP